MILASRHGEILIYVLLVAGAFAYAIGPAVIYLWWRYTSRSPLVLAAGYFALTSVSCLMSGRNSGSLLWPALSLVLVLPWSFLPVLSGSWPESYQALLELMMAGAGLNAAAIHLSARRVVQMEQKYTRYLQQANITLARRR